MLRRCGRLESAGSATSGRRGNSETGQHWWPHLPALPRPVRCPPGCRTVAAGLLLSSPPDTHTRPGTGLRGHSTVMAVTAGFGPRSVPHTPCLGGEVPRGDVLGGGVAGVSLLALGFFGFSLSERRTALVEGRPPLRLPPSLRRSELWWQVTEPQVGVVKAKCTPGPSKRRRGLGSASGAAAVRARVGPSSLQPCAPACPSASSWGGLQAVILPAETPRGEPVPGSGHQGPR